MPRNKDPAPTFTIKNTHLFKLGKLLPHGFKIEQLVQKRQARTQKAESVRKIRKRPRTRQKIRAKNSSDWSERNWGLKMGGESAMKCYEILQNLKLHSLSCPFLQPVDPVALNLPDYLEVIKDPLDLSTVERNLKAGVYQNSMQFATDVRRIWLNSFTYNAVNTEMFYITLELATYFEKQFRDVENLVFYPGKEEKKMNRDKSQLGDYMSRPMSHNEKSFLSASLQRLNQEKLNEAYVIATGKQPNGPFTLNIERLAPKTLRKLEKYVKLTNQADMRGHRQRHLYALKRSYTTDGDEPVKRAKNFYDEVEYY